MKTKHKIYPWDPDGNAGMARVTRHPPLGKFLRAAREKKGWTLRELAAKSGVSNPLISQIETGHTKDPGFRTIIKLVDALGVTIDSAAVAARP